MKLHHTIAIVLALAMAISAHPPGKCMFEKARPITLEGGKYKPIGFGNTKRDFNLKGNFTVHGSKISLYIVDTENFARLINFEKFVSYHRADKVKQGEFDVSLEMGNYHLVWWNESADKTAVIEAEVCFVHPDQ